MAMQNYKVEQADGTESYYQFDDSEEVGKAQLEQLNAAAKNDESPVTKVATGDPEPINKGRASA
jgi:hypothetical protein